MATTRSVPATPMVLIWAQIAPGASAPSMPWSEAIERTASASVTIVTTIAARRAASAADAATCAPRPARSLVASILRSQTITGMPARSALAAIPWPIAPMPSTATGSFAAAIGLSLARCAGRGLASIASARPPPRGAYPRTLRC